MLSNGPLGLSDGRSIVDEDVRVSKELLHNLWAASTSPGSILTEMLCQILMEPSYLEPQRTEAQAAISGGWSEKAISSLPLLDSFIREINCLYPTGSGDNFHSYALPKTNSNDSSDVYSNGNETAIQVFRQLVSPSWISLRGSDQGSPA